MSQRDRDAGGPTAFQRAARRARDRVLRGGRPRDAAARDRPRHHAPPRATAPAPAPPNRPAQEPSPAPVPPAPVAIVTGLEPELAEPPEIEFDAPGPPRITGRTVPRAQPEPQAPPEPLVPPEPDTGEIEIRPLTAELGIHPESIPPPGRPDPHAARWTNFTESFEDEAGTPPPTAGPAASPQIAEQAAGDAHAEPAEPPAGGPALAEPGAAGPAAPPRRRAPAGTDDDWTLIPPPGSRGPTALAAAMLFLGGLGTGTAATLLATEDGGSPAPSAPFAARPAPAPRPAVAAGTPIPLLPRAFALDPYGGDGEHQDQARLAVDGSPATAWTTQRYSAGTLGKPGVGLAVTAARPAEARQITIDTPTPGFRAQVFGAPGGRPAAGSPRSGWTRLSGTTTVRSGRPIRLRAAAPMRHWLVWIVALGPGRQSAEISEIGLRR